ncbi:flavin reductase family protein [Alicyclobacillus herbarius]|uniref:flavin reductase family protein n=1 Tax=Alicyclobacillus herbarius TaxID=122960 RepID=UPI0004157CFD|nr:flavin reductase family protein [Alicyclobacillus herbarius]
MSVQPDTFRRVLARFASGVTVVTMSDGILATGLTVSAFCSVSLNPPYILVCINNTSTALDLVRKSGGFAVHILTEDQADLSKRFASQGTDKLAGLTYQSGLYGAPVLDGVLAHLECSLVQEIPAGDHFILIGQVERGDVHRDAQPLLYFTSQYRQLASTPIM